MNNLAEAYIKTRFPDSVDDYKNEWRRRFADGREWQASDLAGRTLLQELAPGIYPKDVDADY